MMRQSPLLSLYDTSAFEIGDYRDTRIALRAHQQSIRTNYIADLSALRRRLIVGGGASAYLAANGFDRPLNLLESAELDGGALLCRIHRQQYLLLDGLDGNAYDAMFAREEGRYDDALLVPYEAAEIACGGPQLDELIAELCAADISNAPNTTFIPCRFAHCEAILRLIPDPYHLRVLCSPADARFLFSVLREAIYDLKGAVLGLDDYRALLTRAD